MGLYGLREVWVMRGSTVYLNDTSNYGVSHPITSMRILMPRLVIMLTQHYSLYESFRLASTSTTLSRRFTIDWIIKSDLIAFDTKCQVCLPLAFPWVVNLQNIGIHKDKKYRRLYRTSISDDFPQVECPLGILSFTNALVRVEGLKRQFKKLRTNILGSAFVQLSFLHLRFHHGPEVN